VQKVPYFPQLPPGRGEGAISRPFGKLYKMRGEEKRKDNYCKRGKRMWK